MPTSPSSAPGLQGKQEAARSPANCVYFALVLVAACAPGIPESCPSDPDVFVAAECGDAFRLNARVNHLNRCGYRVVSDAADHRSGLLGCVTTVRLVRR